jgi:hypothetical protein
MKVKIAITIEEDLLKIIKLQAEKEKRSLSNQINVCIEKYLEEAAK